MITSSKSLFTISLREEKRLFCGTGFARPNGTKKAKFGHRQFQKG